MTFSWQVLKLILSFQNFQSIEAYSFSRFSNLQYLDLSYSNVADIEENAFGYLPLETVILTGNSITNIPVIFKEPSIDLKKLFLSYNKLKSIDLRNMNNLEEIDLAANSFSNFDPGLFDHLTSLRTLNLLDNMNLKEYTTNAWHFCQNIENGVLNVHFEDGKKFIKDLKANADLDNYCNNNFEAEEVEKRCINIDGHLSCLGNVADLVCQLKNMDFKSIVFDFFKDEKSVKIENFYEAESNAYFTEVNGAPNMTKYLADLKLYGSKFDLATLDDYVGPRTETVTIFADTIYMSRPLRHPVTSRVSLRARVVSITEAKR